MPIDLDIAGGAGDTDRARIRVFTMTRRFWFHVSVSSALAVGFCLFLWLVRNGPAGALRMPEEPASRAAVLALTLVFLFILALLLLRTTGSDRTMGLLGLYALVLSLPFISFITASPRHAAAMVLFALALVESLDADLGRANAVRSGFFASAASVIEPTFLAAAAALMPVIIIIGRSRWKIPLRFLAAFAVPWIVATWLLDMGDRGSSVFSLKEAAVRESDWWIGAFAGQARRLRSLMEDQFLSPYAAMAFAALIVATVRRMGPSRRGVAVTIWLLSVAALSTLIFDEKVVSLLFPLQLLLLVVLANNGLAALASMNPLHAGRRRMIPVAVFFLLPPLVGWMKLLF